MKSFIVVPVIKEKPKIIKIIKKRTIVIECTVASKFEPKCTWYKETNEVKESNRHLYVVEKTKEGEFAVKLEINEVEETDKGAYKLVASNEKGEAVSQIVNLVDIPEEERKPTKPELVRKLTDQKVVEGKSFELLISLKQSDRKCKIEWYKGSTLVKETKEITTTFDGTTARLTISSARVEHSATYKVVAMNEVGKVESMCKIIVEKKQDKKKEDEEAAEVKRKVIKKKDEEKEKVEQKVEKQVKVEEQKQIVEMQKEVEEQVTSNIQQQQVKQQVIVQIEHKEQKSELKQTAAVVQQKLEVKQHQQEKSELRVEQERRVSFSLQQEQVIEAQSQQTAELHIKQQQESVSIMQTKEKRKTSIVKKQKQELQTDERAAIVETQQQQRQDIQQESKTVSQIALLATSSEHAEVTSKSKKSLQSNVTVYELPKFKQLSPKRQSLPREIDSKERKVIFDVQLKPAQPIQRDEVRVH